MIHRLSITYGCAMRNRVDVLLACVLATVGVGSVLADKGTSQTRSTSVVFEVGNASSSQVLADVTALLAGSDEKLITLGHTDATGRLSVRKETLGKRNNVAILFCKERFFCGAFRLDDPEFSKYDYHLIELAPFVVP